MATEKRGVNKKFRSIVAINCNISRSLKDSNVPVLKELSKAPDFMSAYMKNPRYYRALIGDCYLHLYSAIVDAIKAETAVMCREVMAARKAVTPGVWSDYLFMSLAERLLAFGQVALDDPSGEYYVVVKTIEDEISRSKLEERINGYTSEQLSEMDSSAAMKFSEYSDARFTEILTTLVTAILSRCVLLSADRFTPFITTEDQPSIPLKLCRHFLESNRDPVEQWVNNEYGDRMDEGMRAACDSYTKYTIQDLMQYIAALANYGGINPTLTSAVLAKTGITPTCDYENFDDIADLRFSITYLMNYGLDGKAPISASFTIAPGHIMNVATHKNASISARRAVGRMMADAVTAFVRYCMVILSEDPDIIVRYTMEHIDQPSDNPDGSGVTIDVDPDQDPADDVGENVHPNEQD